MRKTCNPTYLWSQKSRLESRNYEIWPIHGLTDKIPNPVSTKRYE